MNTFNKFTLAFVTLSMFCVTQNTFAQNPKKKLAAAVGKAVQMVQQGQNQTKVLAIQQPAPGYQAVQPYVAPAPMPQPPVQLGFSGTITCEGMRVVSVVCGSYAEQLGLESGDIITHINGQKVRDLYTYQSLLVHAVQYDHGHLDLRIKNVRANWDPYAARYVQRHIDLPHDHYDVIVPAGSQVTPGL